MAGIVRRKKRGFGHRVRLEGCARRQFEDDCRQGLVTGTLLMGQVERACNRLYGVETDRPTLVAALAAFAAGQTPGSEPGRMRVGLAVYGRPPLFTARLDAPHFQGQRSLASPRGERYYLDRQEESLLVRPHQAFSLLQHAGDLTRAGVDYFVVDISQGQLKRECAEVTALLSGRGTLPEVFSGNYDGILA